MPITKTLQQITAAGFQRVEGPNAWYYPEGLPAAPAAARIHIGGSIDHSGVPSMNIAFVSIVLNGQGQNLQWNQQTGKWNLNTPNINWGEYEGEMQNVLTTLGIAS